MQEISSWYWRRKCSPSDTSFSVDSTWSNCGTWTHPQTSAKTPHKHNLFLFIFLIIMLLLVHYASSVQEGLFFPKKFSMGVELKEIEKHLRSTLLLLLQICWKKFYCLHWYCWERHQSFSYKPEKTSSTAGNNMYHPKNPSLLCIVPVSSAAATSSMWQLEWGFTAQSGDVEHTRDSIRLQFWTWGWGRKEAPLEAEELLCNWRKVRSRKSNFFQAYLLQERFCFRTSYKPFHQVENPLGLQRFSGYVLERSATPPQNSCEAFKHVSQSLSFCLRYLPSLSFFLLFTPLLPARTAARTKQLFAAIRNNRDKHIKGQLNISRLFLHQSHLSLSICCDFPEIGTAHMAARSGWVTRCVPSAQTSVTGTSPKCRHPAALQPVWADRLPENTS